MNRIRGTPQSQLKRAYPSLPRGTLLTSPIRPHPITPTPRGASAIWRDEACLVAEVVHARGAPNDALGTTNPEAPVAARASRANVCIIFYPTARKRRELVCGCRARGLGGCGVWGVGSLSGSAEIGEAESTIQRVCRSHSHLTSQEKYAARLVTVRGRKGRVIWDKGDRSSWSRQGL